MRCLIDIAVPPSPANKAFCASGISIELVSYPLLNLEGIPAHSSSSNRLPLGELAFLHQRIDMAAPKPADLLRLLEAHDAANTPLLNHLNLLLAMLHFPNPSLRLYGGQWTLGRESYA